jgi:hypothetical protein
MQVNRINLLLGVTTRTRELLLLLVATTSSSV